MSKALPEHLKETLTKVMPVTWRSTAYIYEEMPIKAYIGVSAVSNRLAQLKKIGLVVVQRRGKEKFWRRVK